MPMHLEIAGPVIQTTIKVVRYVVEFLQMLIHLTLAMIGLAILAIKKAAIVVLKK